MNEDPVTDTLLRQFLLGKVDDQERQRIESMFVTGALSEERLIAAEQHLLDDYLDDSLTPEDRERFLAQYGETPAEQRKLRIAKTIQDWAAAGHETQVAPVAVSRWSRLRERFRLNPVFMIPIAAVFTIAIVFAAVWLNSRWQQQNRHLAMQQELIRLNSPSALRDISSPVPPLKVMPGRVRSAEPGSELTQRADIEFVELHLLWTQKEQYPSYQATIRRFQEDESFTVSNLQGDKNVIRLRLPTSLISRGLYQIEVTGVSVSGAKGLPEEFEVSSQGIQGNYP